MIRKVLLLGLLLISGTVWAVPEVLIAQVRMPAKGEEDPNVFAMDALADELDKEGKLFPIVWSQSDPIFRSAVNEGLIPDSTPPNLERAKATAQKMHFEYLLIFSAVQEQTNIKAEVELFQKGRSIWKDKKVLGVSSDTGIDRLSSARSLARTWNSMLSQGPLKKLPSLPRAETPEIAPGQLPPPPVFSPPPVIPNVDNTKFLAELNGLLDKGNKTDALLLAREAVDDEPLDEGRRLALCNALVRCNHLLLAVDAANDASEILPKSLPIQLFMVRAYAYQGEIEKAKQALMPAIAHSPKDSGVQLCDGILSLLEGKTERAQGRFADLKADVAWVNLAKAIGEGKCEPLAQPFKDPIDAALAFRISQQALKNSTDALKDWIPSARRDRKATGLQDTLNAQARVCRGLDSYWSGLSPESRKKSLEQWFLALKLLQLSLIDAQAFLESGDEAAATDSGINLGETVRQLQEAEQTFLEESR